MKLALTQELRRLHAGPFLRLGRKAHALLQKSASIQGHRAPRETQERIGLGRLSRSAGRRTDGSGEVTRSLRIALAGGGFETALQHADELTTATGRLDTKALELVSRAFMTAGRQREACKLWERHATHADRAHPTWIALRLAAGDADISWHTLDDSNHFLIDQGVQRGHLDPERVAALVLRRPLSALLNPERYLLHFNAAQVAGQSGAGGLRNFFEANGLGFDFRGFHTGVPSSAIRPSPIWGPTVSVAMSARNAQSTVLAAASSVLAQTYGNLELLICDDASDDDTMRVLREAFSADRRVRLFRSHACQGTYNVRNQLFARARGALLTTHDADDFALPTRIADQVRAMQRTGAQACIGNWLRVRANGSVAFFWDQRAVRLSVVSLMVRREVSDQLGPYRSARYGADLEHFEKLRQGAYRVARTNRPLMLSLWGQTSLTRSVAAEALENGYRAPGRRAYSEVVFQRQLLGPSAVPDSAVTDLLMKHDNYCEATGLAEVT